MDINFLIEKWKEFENDEEKYSKCMGYVEARKKNILDTNKLLKNFINSKISLKVFKNKLASKSEKELGLEKKTIISIWGANQFKGSILFTLLMKYSTLKEKKLLEEVLKECFIFPVNIKDAVFKIDLFSEHLEMISNTITPEKIKKSEYPDKNWTHIKGAINPSHASVFIPVFWDMQKLDRYPIYYSSCKNVIKVLDECDKYYKKSNSAGENYKFFYDFNIELINRINKEYNKELKFSDISTNYLNYIFKTYIEKK